MLLLPDFGRSSLLDPMTNEVRPRLAIWLRTDAGRKALSARMVTPVLVGWM